MVIVAVVQGVEHHLSWAEHCLPIFCWVPLYSSLNESQSSKEVGDWSWCSYWVSQGLDKTNILLWKHGYDKILGSCPTRERDITGVYLDLISHVVVVAGELVDWEKSDIASVMVQTWYLLLLSNSVLMLPSPLHGSTLVCRIRLCLGF